MKLDDLIHSCGEWLRGVGPDSDIVLSSRVRLARNLADFPFTGRASPMQRGEIEGLLREKLQNLKLDDKLHYFSLHHMESVDRQLLVERQLVSREHAAAQGQRGVAFDTHEVRSIMVNEEDHLRMQVIRSGFQLEEAWREIDQLDDLIEHGVAYAYSDEFGYLTACPTNTGTGMRASVLLHLPALQMTKQVEKVFRALQKISLAVRGLYGEGTRASGDFYQISNQVTLGKGEEDIIREIREVIPQILDYERTARAVLMKESRALLQDRISRAYGTLISANVITSEETMDLLSCVRLGINLHLIEEIEVPTVNELFLMTQPAHLQKLEGDSLDGEERNVFRARYLRQRLRRNGDH